MKLLRKLGSTSQILQIFIRDSSSTKGDGLTGLVFNTASLTAYYHRDTDTATTAISLVTMTTGTFTSSGFKEIDAANMPGWYQFCPPNTAFVTGASSVGIHLKGATNMAPLPIEVDLDSQVDVTSWNGTAVASPATAGIPDVNTKNINNVVTTSVTTINAVVGTATVGSTATALSTAQTGITTLLTGVTLTSAGLDSVLVESGIAASSALTNDAGTQLTSINARQALSLSISPLAGLLSGAGTTTIAIKPGGNSSGNTRVSATVDASNNRIASNIKVPT